MGSLKRNTLYSAITNLSDALQLLLTLFAGRILGPERFGSFNSALSLSIVCMTISNLGLNTIAVRDVSQDHSRAKSYLANILGWKLLLSVVAFGALLVSSRALNGADADITPLVMVLGVSVMARFFTLTARCFLQAQERFHLEAVGVFIEQALLVAAGLAVLACGGGLVPFALAFLGARLVGIAVSYSLLRRHVPIRIHLDLPFMWGLQRHALPVGLALLVMTAYTHIDTLMLTRMAEFVDVGHYNAAFKVYFAMFMLPSIVCTVMLPRMSRRYAEGKHSFNKLLLTGLGLMTALGIPVAVLGVFLGEWGITLVFGEDYRAAGAPMRILCGTAAITFQVWLLRIVMVATNRRHALMWFYFSALFIHGVVAYILIPRLDIAGAAWATLASETYLFLGIWIYLLLRHFKIRGVSDGLQAAGLAFRAEY